MLEQATRREAMQAVGQGLLYRWFVVFNPLYLLSAALVLGGMVLLSRGLAHDGSLYGQIGVAAIAEAYAAALIGAAALLTRIGQRRSAVMLALLTALYQCDLTLHTETCPNLGAIGIAATVAWLTLFVVKLILLARAMKVRLAPSAVATATLGAAGLAILPYCFAYLGPRPSGVLVTLWLLSLSLLRRSGAVTSLVDLDGWGQTVRGRTVRAVWILWSVLLGLHLLFWCTQYRLDLAAVAALAPLLFTRWARNEAQIWCATVGALVLVAIAHPAAFSLTALVAGVALGVRGWAAGNASSMTKVEGERPVAPYRTAAGGEPLAAALALAPVVAGPAVLRRLLVGAAFALYLSIWTIGWSGGAWPAHLVALDVGMSLAVVLGAALLHARFAIAPLAIVWGHFAVAVEIVSAPRSTLGWGTSAIGLGFGLLIASVAISYWLRRVGTEG